jgi:hypothetical protein
MSSKSLVLLFATYVCLDTSVISLEAVNTLKVRTKTCQLDRR